MNTEVINQQIEDAAAFLKASLMPNARTRQEAEYIKHKTDSLKHEVKALLAIVKEQDFAKAMVHIALSQKLLRQCDDLYLL